MQAGTQTSLASLGSMSLEFTRLSQLTGDPKYYDAIARITDELEKAQKSPKMPGLWPVQVNAAELKFEAKESAAHSLRSTGLPRKCAFGSQWLH